MEFIEKQICDCGNELEFDSDCVVEILDRYDNKILVLCKYYCSKCFDEYFINIEVTESQLSSLSK